MSTSFFNDSYFTGSVSASGSTGYTGGAYNTDWLDRKYEYRRTEQGYNNLFNAQNADIENKIANIQSYIKNGKEDKAMEAYQELLQDLASQPEYQQLNEGQLKALVKQMLEANLEDGQTLEEFIKENTANSFERGFEINWDGDQYKEQDLLEEMCGLDEHDRFDGLKEVGGAALKTGGMAAAGAAIGSIFGPVGAVGGAIIGGLIGLFS